MKVDVDVAGFVDTNDRQTVAFTQIDFTVCKKKDGKNVFTSKSFDGVGATIRSLRDKDNPMIGAQLAVAEALECIASRIKKDAWEQIKSRGSKPLSDEELMNELFAIEDEIYSRSLLRELDTAMKKMCANTPEAVAKRQEREAKRAA